jgi:hypothetical protein
LRHGGIADGGLNTLTVTENASIVARHSDDMATHMVLACEGRRYRLIIIGDMASTAPLSFMLPVDHFWDVRRAAMSAFQEHVHLGVRRPRPACLEPGHSERWRLVQWLRILDALPEGVSARELAVDLIARDAGHYSSAEWDSSSERKRIARWQRNALAVRDGGYLRLLNGH